MKALLSVVVLSSLGMLSSSAGAQGFVTQCWAESQGKIWVIPAGNPSFELCRDLAVICTDDQNAKASHSTNQRMIVPPAIGEAGTPVEVCHIHPNAASGNKKPATAGTAKAVPDPPKPPRWHHPLDVDRDGWVSYAEHQVVVQAEDGTPPHARTLTPPQQVLANEAQALATCHRSDDYMTCLSQCNGRLTRERSPPAYYDGECGRICACARCGDANPQISDRAVYECHTRPLRWSF